MECSPRATKLCTTELILKPTVPYSQRSLSHAVLRLGTDSPADECSEEKREGLGREKIHTGRNLMAGERENA